MRVASSLEDFLAAPVGSCLPGRTFLYFYPTAGFNGFRLWGDPDEADIDALLAVLDVTRRPGTVPYLSLIDTSRMDRIQPIVFSRMADYQASRMASYAVLIRRQAMVRPTGLWGAIVAGFYHQLRPTFPVEVFDGVPEALDWLGWAGARAWYPELEALWQQLAGDAPVVRELRRVLDGDLRATLATAARALGMTERTLQRRLQEGHTSFQAEVNAARVRIAQARMLTSDDKLATIAREVGCASLQHFSALFHKVTGQTPTAWRARQGPARSR